MLLWIPEMPSIARNEFSASVCFLPVAAIVGCALAFLLLRANPHSMIFDTERPAFCAAYTGTLAPSGAAFFDRHGHKKTPL